MLPRLHPATPQARPFRVEGQAGSVPEAPQQAGDGSQQQETQKASHKECHTADRRQHLRSEPAEVGADLIQPLLGRPVERFPESHFVNPRCQEIAAPARAGSRAPACSKLADRPRSGVANRIVFCLPVGAILPRSPTLLGRIVPVPTSQTCVPRRHRGHELSSRDSDRDLAGRSGRSSRPDFELTRCPVSARLPGSAGCVILFGTPMSRRGDGELGRVSELPSAGSVL